MTSVASKAEQFREQQTKCLRQQNECFRNLRDGDMDEMKSLYNELDTAHKHQAWAHALAAAFSLLSIGASGFDKNNSVGKALNACAAFGDKGSSFFRQLKDNDVAHLNGILDQLKKALEDLERTNSDLSHKDQETKQMLTEAIRMANQALSAPFDRMN